MQHSISPEIHGFEVEIRFTTHPIDIDSVTPVDVIDMTDAAKFLDAHPRGNGSEIIEGRNLSDDVEHEAIVEELLARAGEVLSLGDWEDEAEVCARDAEAIGL